MEQDTPTLNAEVIQSVIDGDLNAFNGVMLTLQTAIFNHLYRLTGSRDDAVDLVQETFLKVFTKRQLINPEENFKAWVYKIATNTAYDWFAKNKKINEVTSLDESMLETIEDNLPYYRIDEASRIDLEQALQKIRPAYQTVITLFYQQGFTYEEIARIMGISLGTVKTFLYRAKQSLAEELKNYE